MYISNSDPKKASITCDNEKHADSLISALAKRGYDSFKKDAGTGSITMSVPSNMPFAKFKTSLEDALVEVDPEAPLEFHNNIVNVAKDSKLKGREFLVYEDWKKAVKDFIPEATFTGDKNKDSCSQKDLIDAEWDGTKGHLSIIPQFS